MKYNLTKRQIKMLLDDKPLKEGNRKIYASENVKEVLREIDSNNLYDKATVKYDSSTGWLDVIPKVGEGKEDLL